MWNSYWSGRTRRELPQVNYNESSEEEENFDSPLQSPNRPVNTRQGSPVELAVPHLNDNVDEELEQVSQALSNVGHSHVFRGTRPVPGARPEPEGGNQTNEPPPELVEEEVVEGYVVGGGDNPKDDAGDDGSDGDEGGANMVDPVNVDEENGQDGEKAADTARAIKLEFDPSDIRFWFSQLEDEMTMASVKSQWLKKTVLQRNLPVKQKEDVKAYLTLQKAEAGDQIYLDIKTELIRIYAPKPADSYRKALTRTMTGLPSQLGYQIINDICKKPSKLNGCCCAGAALALWSIQLPISVRTHISQKEFTKDTYKSVFQDADKVFLASKQVAVSAIQVAAASLDETLPAFSEQNQPAPEIAALAKKAKGSGGGGNNGGGKKNKPPKKSNRGQKHSSVPEDQADKMCDRHFRHGAGAWYCLTPSSCPWKNKCSPKQ